MPLHGRRRASVGPGNRCKQVMTAVKKGRAELKSRNKEGRGHRVAALGVSSLLSRSLEPQKIFDSNLIYTAILRVL